MKNTDIHKLAVSIFLLLQALEELLNEEGYDLSEYTAQLDGEDEFGTKIYCEEFNLQSLIDEAKADLTTIINIEKSGGEA